MSNKLRATEEYQPNVLPSRKFTAVASSAAFLALSLSGCGSDTPKDPEYSKPTPVVASVQPSSDLNFMKNGTLDITESETKITHLPPEVAQHMKGVIAVSTYIGMEKVTAANGVTSYEGATGVSRGTGFKIDNDSVITAGHVTEGVNEGQKLNCDYSSVETRIGNQPTILPAVGKQTLFIPGQYAKSADIAQLDLKIDPAVDFASLPSATLATDVPDSGEVVYNINLQGEKEGKFNSPIKKDFKEVNALAGAVYLTDESAAKTYVLTGLRDSFTSGLSYNIRGASGSPMFNSEGEVWGITSATRVMPAEGLSSIFPEAPPVKDEDSKNNLVAITTVQHLTHTEKMQLDQSPVTPCNNTVPYFIQDN